MKLFFQLSILLFFVFAGPGNSESPNEEKLELAADLRDSNRINDAYNIARSLAVGGDPEAMAFMAGLASYQNAPLSREKAAEWTRKAADLGHASSQWRVAIYYRFGQYGYPKDLQLAVDWSRKSAAQDYTWAHQTILDIGSQSNLISPAELAASAAAVAATAGSGDHFWMNQMGENYRLGTGVHRDLDKAEEWFSRVLGAEGINNTDSYDHYQAMVGIGQIYSETAVSIDDIQRALDLFLVASSDQYCGQYKHMGNNEWACSAIEPMNLAEARLSEIQCTAGFDQSVIGDPVDLFNCNQLSAVAHFARERRIMMAVEGISVSDGALLIQSHSGADWREAARLRLQTSWPDLTWNDSNRIWAQMEQPRPFNCIMELAAAQHLEKGSVVEIFASLRNLDGIRPTFDCRL